MRIKEAGLYYLKTAACYYAGMVPLVVHGEASMQQSYAIGILVGIGLMASEMRTLNERRK